MFRNRSLEEGHGGKERERGNKREVERIGARENFKVFWWEKNLCCAC